MASMVKKHRAFLKWAGGKYRLTDAINKLLPSAERLVEPFVGAGSVFLNSQHKSYLLNDINSDLIDLYQIIQSRSEQFIDDAQKIFCPANNSASHYYQLRTEFNTSKDKYYRALLFLYLNRHGYNGLCRYNKSGGYNVPFGQYKKPYFPEAELWFFAEKAQHANFVCESYQQTLARVENGDAIYCDPPYVPLSKTASFTSYAGNGFNLDDQAELANVVEQVVNNKQVSVLISNHDTIWTRKIYNNATKINSINVARTISQQGNKRKKVAELLAFYK